MVLFVVSISLLVNVDVKICVRVGIVRGHDTLGTLNHSGACIDRAVQAHHACTLDDTVGWRGSGLDIDVVFRLHFGIKFCQENNKKEKELEGGEE